MDPWKSSLGSKCVDISCERHRSTVPGPHPFSAKRPKPGKRRSVFKAVLFRFYDPLTLNSLSYLLRDWNPVLPFPSQLNCCFVLKNLGIRKHATSWESAQEIRIKTPSCPTQQHTRTFPLASLTRPCDPVPDDYPSSCLGQWGQGARWYVRIPSGRDPLQCSTVRLPPPASRETHPLTFSPVPDAQVPPCWCQLDLYSLSHLGVLVLCPPHSPGYLGFPLLSLQTRILWQAPNRQSVPAMLCLDFGFSCYWEGEGIHLPHLYHSAQWYLFRQGQGGEG